MEVGSRGGNISSTSSLSLSATLPPPQMRPRFMCRRLEKLCCLAAGYFPLLFVYSLTSWAAYTEVYSISWRAMGGFRGLACGTLGGLLYGMLIWSYTHAVFTKPGSPIDNKQGYSFLPTSDPSHVTSSVTVKSDGKERFCKKCQCRKPDRAHHCSSCKTCVLKMDHHCPWLANCLGLYNYKAFLLFLIYTSVFCLVCFFVSIRLVYVEIFSDGTSGDENSYGGNIEDITPVNWVLLVVISGIIGLVLSGFTIWHLLLTASNMTTIESLEKVRYNAPSLRSGAPPPGAHLVDSYNSHQQEQYHEVRRYNEYLLEESSKKLPHAFNLGRARNFAQVFGGRDRMWLWCLPMFTGSGDGWTWETSQEWREAAETIRLERDRWAREQTERERAAGWGGYEEASPDLEWEGRGEEEAVGAGYGIDGGNPNGLIKYAGGQRQQSKVERLLGRPAGSYTDAEGVPLRTLTRPAPDVLDDNMSDEDEDLSKPLPSPPPPPLPPKKVNHSAGGMGNPANQEWDTWG